MENRNKNNSLWVIWWLLAIMISVLCISFTGVKRAYGQERKIVKDANGRVTHTIRTRNDGSREIKDASGKVEAVVRTDNSGRERVYGSDGKLKYITNRSDTTTMESQTF